MFFSYITHYLSPVPRLLHDILVAAPINLWGRYLCLVVPSSRRFVNRSGLSDDQLELAWQQAQADTMNGVAMDAPDGRGKDVQPSNVRVIAVEDEPVESLRKAFADLKPGTKDPTGCFLIVNGGITEYQSVVGLTRTGRRPRVYFAKSAPQVLAWEFQNVILSKLGYDVGRR